jgi:lysophospholipase L1-like esterase
MKKTRIRYTTLASAMIFSITSASAHDSRASGPIMMGVMGDSISAGTLADFPIPPESSNAQTTFSTSSADLQERLIFENKLTLSWASGVSIRSHYMRLREYLRRKGERRAFYVDNVSYPGRMSEAMPNQAQQLVQDFYKGHYSTLKYVTLLIGSNDACHSVTPWGVPAQEIHDNVIKALGILSQIKQDEPIRVLIVGIPRIPDLGEASLKNSKSIFGLTCNTIRSQILSECDFLLNWKTEAEYDHDMMIVESDNRALRATAQEANQKFPNIQAVYSDRLYNLNIPRSILAADCFHPNAYGQQELADEVWLDQPWFD